MSRLKEAEVTKQAPELMDAVKALTDELMILNAYFEEITDSLINKQDLVIKED